MMSCGGQIQTTVRNLGEDVLGTCATFEEKQVGDKRYNFFQGGNGKKSATVVLRGGAEHFIEEAERSLHDALCIVRRARANTTVVVCAPPPHLIPSPQTPFPSLPMDCWNLKRFGKIVERKGVLVMEDSVRFVGVGCGVEGLRSDVSNPGVVFRWIVDSQKENMHKHTPQPTGRRRCHRDGDQQAAPRLRTPDQGQAANHRQQLRTRSRGDPETGMLLRVLIFLLSVWDHSRPTLCMSSTEMRF